MVLERKWLIEGHGVDPDIVVDNPPQCHFRGQDAQLETAIRLSLEQIKEHPISYSRRRLHPNKTLPCLKLLIDLGAGVGVDLVAGRHMSV